MTKTRLTGFYGNSSHSSGDYLIDLEDAAVIRRDRKGKLHVKMPGAAAVIAALLRGDVKDGATICGDVRGSQLDVSYRTLSGASNPHQTH